MLQEKLGRGAFKLLSSLAANIGKNERLVIDLSDRFLLGHANERSGRQGSLPEQSQEALAYTYGLVPARYTHPEWAIRVGLSSWDYLPHLTNTFLHGGWLHLILNMWTLWLFWPAVEDRLGSLRYVLFYALCGVAASAAHAWMNADSTVPAVGASGAIAGSWS